MEDHGVSLSSILYEFLKPPWVPYRIQWKRICNGFEWIVVLRFPSTIEQHRPAILFRTVIVL
jgi:hypothetical protein